MKHKRVRIAVEPLSRTQVRWKKALEGKVIPKEDLITVASWEVLGKVLSAPRLEILGRTPTLRPKSIAALARNLGRDFDDVYADVMFLADLGLVQMKAEGRRKTLTPIVPFSGIEVDWVAAA